MLDKGWEIQVEITYINANGERLALRQAQRHFPDTSKCTETKRFNGTFFEKCTRPPRPSNH